MFKKLLLTFSLLGFVNLANADNIKKEVFDNVVRVEHVDGGGFCTGTIVHSDRDKESGKVTTNVLTAKHCVKGDEGKTVAVAKFTYDDRLRQIKSERYLAEVKGSSWKSDLAILELKDQQTIFPTAIVAKKDVVLSFGDDVISVGFPLGMSMTFTKGNLGFVEEQKAFADISQSTEFYRATPDIAGGNSGGGLFINKNDKYELIGVVTGGHNFFTWFNYFTPIEEINEYLGVVGKDWVERNLKEEDKK